MNPLQDLVVVFQRNCDLTNLRQILVLWEEGLGKLSLRHKEGSHCVCVFTTVKGLLKVVVFCLLKLKFVLFCLLFVLF
jgi:hypothetical protein